MGMYLCWGVLVLGWIGFVMGLVLRKLAGLEAMVVVQFLWLNMVWFDGTLYSPLGESAVLRFSVGYNVPIFQQ